MYFKPVSANKPITQPNIQQYRYVVADLPLHTSQAAESVRNTVPSNAYRNAKGYEMAEKYKSKFSHIAPVWLQLQWSSVQQAFTVAGKHDVDTSWMKRVKGKLLQVSH